MEIKNNEKNKYINNKCNNNAILLVVLCFVATALPIRTNYISIYLCSARASASS